MHVRYTVLLKFQEGGALTYLPTYQSASCISALCCLTGENFPNSTVLICNLRRLYRPSIWVPSEGDPSKWIKCPKPQCLSNQRWAFRIQLLPIIILKHTFYFFIYFILFNLFIYFFFVEKCGAGDWMRDVLAKIVANRPQDPIAVLAQ